MYKICFQVYSHLTMTEPFNELESAKLGSIHIHKCSSIWVLVTETTRHKKYFIFQRYFISIISELFIGKSVTKRDSHVNCSLNNAQQTQLQCILQNRYRSHWRGREGRSVETCVMSNRLWHSSNQRNPITCEQRRIQSLPSILPVSPRTDLWRLHKTVVDSIFFHHPVVAFALPPDKRCLHGIYWYNIRLMQKRLCDLFYDSHITNGTIYYIIALQKCILVYSNQ